MTTQKVTIDSGTVDLYINDVVNNSVSCNTSYPLKLSGGSSSNPIYMTDLKIKKV